MDAASLLNERYKYVFEEALLKEIQLIGEFRRIKADSVLIEIGDAITHMPIVLEGAIRILNEDKEGNEYLLYYLEIGDSCAMTMSCCIGGKRSNIRAITEKETLLYMLPISYMEKWLVSYKSWRAYVFESYDVRLNEMLEAINTVVFKNMEGRLYKYLKDRAMVMGSPQLDITHHRIAHDLNTSRVVISRLMKKLVLDHKIEAHRNQIIVRAFTSDK